MPRLSRVDVENREQRALREGKEPISESTAVGAMKKAEKLRDETFDPEVTPQHYDPDPDPDYPAPVDHAFTGYENSDQRKLRAAAKKVKEKQEEVLKGPLDENLVRPPAMAADDLIREGKGSTDEFRAAAAEQNQEEALDDLHLRRTHNLSDEEIAKGRSAARAARNERAEELVRRESRGDALKKLEERLAEEGDSLAIEEPDHISRAKHYAESQEQAEAMKVKRRTPMTPEPHHERGKPPESR